MFDHACLIPGINIFLDGYVPTENLRFRETSLVFKVAETANEEEVKRLRHYQVSSASGLIVCHVWFGLKCSSHPSFFFSIRK